jgi:hypothetical protein
MKANLLFTPGMISGRGRRRQKSNSFFLERTNDPPSHPPNRAVGYDKEAQDFLR